MPQISKTSTPADYQNIRRDSFTVGERNDCTVVAVALLANVPYEAAHAALAAEGRKNGKGAYLDQYLRALVKLGKTVRRINDREEIISKFPSPHNNLQHITSHHPRRFAKVWDKEKNYLMQSKGHALAVIKGETKDWSINKSLRIISIYEVI